MFVPATPNSELKRKYEAVIKNSKFNFKIIEKSGRSIKSMTQKSNPFKNKTCRDSDRCMVCSGEGKDRGRCRTENVEYRIRCSVCGNEYLGETGRNAYSRGRDHQNALNKKHKSSVLWRHTNEKHRDDVTPPLWYDSDVDTQQCPV